MRYCKFFRPTCEKQKGRHKENTQQLLRRHLQLQVPEFFHLTYIKYFSSYLKPRPHDSCHATFIVFHNLSYVVETLNRKTFSPTCFLTFLCVTEITVATQARECFYVHVIQEKENWISLVILFLFLK